MIAVIFHIMGEGTKKARKLFSRSQAFLDKIASVFFFSIKETFFVVGKRGERGLAGLALFCIFASSVRVST